MINFALISGTLSKFVTFYSFLLIINLTLLFFQSTKTYLFLFININNFPYFAFFMLQLSYYTVKCIIIRNKTLKIQQNIFFESHVHCGLFWTPLCYSYITFKTWPHVFTTRGQKKTLWKHSVPNQLDLLNESYVSFNICLFLLCSIHLPLLSLSSRLFCFWSVCPWESAEDTCWEQVWWRTEETSSYRTGK